MLLGFLFAGPLAALDFEGMILDRVLVVSNVNVPLARIKSALTLREGEPVSTAKLRADFRSLWNLNLFRDLRFEVAPATEDRVNLIVTVEERYRVRSVKILGVVKFSEQTLLDEIPLKVDEYYSAGLVNRAVNAIKDKYRGAGFLMTRVKTDVKTLERRKEVEVVLDVSEGSEMLIGKIAFRGNASLTGDQIKKDMELHEDHWYREGKYDDLLLEEDKKKILYAYKKAGFVNARIVDTQVAIRWRDPAKKDVREVNLTFDISEGGKYYFGDVQIRGNRLFTEADLRRRLRRKAGEVFNQEVHDRDLQALGLLYQERGFIFARITPVESVDEKTKKIAHLLDIYEGEKAHVERIFIQGNDKTKDFVIRRELEIQEGEVFNALKVRRSFERIMNLQFFKNVVPDYRPGSAEGLMNLVFSVEEQRTGIISAGVGIGTASGLSLNAEVRENNFRGLGQTLGFKIEFGQLRKIASVNFSEPWILPHGPQVSLGASFSASLTVAGYALPSQYLAKDPSGNMVATNNPNGGAFLYQDTLGQLQSNWSPDLTASSSLAGQLPYTYAVFGTSVFASTRFAYWWVFGWQNAFEIKRNFFDTLWPADSRVPSQKELTRQPIVREQYNMATALLEDEPWKPTFTTTFTLGRDTRDNTLNPTRGTYAKASVDFVFINNQLTRWNLQWSAYKKFLKYFVFAWQSDLWSLGDPIGGHSQFRAELDQYYTFTREEVRGWEYADIALLRSTLSAKPQNADRNYTLATSAGNYVNYGSAKVRHGLEVRFPIAEQVLWGLLFVDAGNLSATSVFSNGLDFAFPIGQGMPQFEKILGEYMFDMGVGLRLQIPAFPIRLYLSWKFRYYPEIHNFAIWRQDTTKIFGRQVDQDMAKALSAFGDTQKAAEAQSRYDNGGGFNFPAPTVVLNIFGYF
ncbi:MAG: outer membrane protein assembly factor BamA [Spirochaetes bacterium]|nr:outer membrane protein assembly factor BamA [Spirochaetota bacterium]